jgi:hypothetical protein
MLKYLMLILSIALYGTSHAQSKRKSLIGESAVLMDDDLHKTLYCGNSYTYFASLEKISSTQADKAAFVKTIQAKGKVLVEKAGFKCPECDDPSAAGCDLSVQVSDEKGLSITEKNENGKIVFTLEEQVIEYRVSCSLCETDKKKETVDAQGKPIPATTSPAMSDHHSVEQQTKCNEENMIFAILQGMKVTTGTVDEAFDAVMEMIAKNSARFGFGCKLCPDGTRRCEVEVKRLDADLREKALLPKPLVMDSTKEGIIIPAQIIRIFYACLDCPTQKQDDPNNAADSDGDAVPDATAAETIVPAADAKSTASDELKVTAKGTGQTTGHIADIDVKNNGDDPITVLPQTAYIPSSGQYQPYIATIPGIALLPGVTTTIPVPGYCVDVHKPPVSNGDPMPPIEKWIPVGDPNAPIPEGTVHIIPTIPVLPFHTGDIPGILNSPEYESTPPNDPDTPVMITWPGTDIPVGGTFVPGNHPEKFAPVMVKTYEEITKAVNVIQSKDEYATPFSSDSVKEHQALTQNVIWIYTAELSGDKYEKEDFAKNLYTQFEKTSGKTVASLPAEQKEKIDSGVDDFWNVFTAVGVEAKVISNPDRVTGTGDNVPPPEDPPSDVPPPEKVKDPCSLTEEVTDTGPKLDYAIANTGTKEKNEEVKEAFKSAIHKAAGIITEAKGNDTIDIAFSTPEMPASAWSLWFPHVVAGQANATAFAVDTKKPTKSAMTTEPLETKSDGAHTVVLTHILGENCTSTLVGINFAKVRASSGLSATLGNIEALKLVNFVGEIAIDIIIKKGKGTYKKFGKYLKEKTKDMAKDEAKEFIKKVLKEQNEKLKDKSEEDAEKAMDELLKEIKDGPVEEDELEEGKEALDDWLAEYLIEGDEIDPKEKMESDILDKIDSPIDWSPIKTNTYAIGEGSLDVYVDGDHGLAKTASGASYKREELEGKEEAEKGGGVFCNEGIASHVTSGTITLRTIGKTGSWAGATGEGIISTGHGRATASIESFNGMFVIAICECPDFTDYDTFTSITSYTKEEIMSGVWVRVFENLMTDVADQIKTTAKTGEEIEKDLKNAAIRASQSILPCEK